MPRAGIDDEFFAFDLEHKAVGFVDMHAPPTRKVAVPVGQCNYSRFGQCSEEGH